MRGVQRDQRHQGGDRRSQGTAAAQTAGDGPCRRIGGAGGGHAAVPKEHRRDAEPPKPEDLGKHLQDPSRKPTDTGADQGIIMKKTLPKTHVVSFSFKKRVRKRNDVRNTVQPNGSDSFKFGFVGEFLRPTGAYRAAFGGISNREGSCRAVYRARADSSARAYR